MSAFKQVSFDCPSASGSKERARQHLAHETLQAPITPALRYSSPRPWILGVAISSTMWVGIGWLIFRFA
jgi:hypothetical protein